MDYILDKNAYMESVSTLGDMLFGVFMKWVDNPLRSYLFILLRALILFIIIYTLIILINIVY